MGMMGVMRPADQQIQDARLFNALQIEDVSPGADGRKLARPKVTNGGGGLERKLAHKGGVFDFLCAKLELALSHFGLEENRQA
jgi:hypothetical protein